jgi:hypothetical protein
MLFRRWAIKVCIKYLILQKTHRSRKEGSIREFFLFKKKKACAMNGISCCLRV